MEKAFYPMFGLKLDCDKRRVGVRKLKSSLQLRKMRVKIAFKYGILVTIVIAVWVTMKNFVFHLEGPAAPIIDTAVFNLASIVGLVLGIREKRTANGGSLSYLDGFKTGISIAVTYALLTCLYFGVIIALTGPGLMQRAGHTSYVSAFTGLAIGLALFGTVFSAVIALILRKT